MNPEVQNRDLDTQLLFLCFLFLFLRGLCYTCIPFDASALLWKVNDKYDPNLTILCTFLHRGGRFTALKKKKKDPVGFLGVSQAPQDRSQSIIFFPERWVQMNGRSTSSPAPNSWGGTVPCTGLAWLPLPTACHQDLASTEVFICVPCRGHSYCMLSIVLEN